MFFKQSATVKEEISTRRALRHLLVFQFKLAMDAIRDFALSPISILVFIIDAIRKPRVEDSLYLRLMNLGRRSDRVINLFDEYSDSGEYTVDETLAEVEQALWGELEKKRQPLEKGEK
jgi:hypothetical protein